MVSQSPVLKTVGESYDFALRAFAPSAPYLAAFALSVALVMLLPRVDLDPLVSLFLEVISLAVAFAAGCIYSAKLYGLALRTGPDFPSRDDVFNLGMANAAIYGCFAIVGFLLSLFPFILSGVLVAHVTGLDGETAETNPDAVQSAFAEMFSGPAGLLVGLVSVLSLVVLAYLALRLVLFGIATFARSEIRVFSTWRWTRENLQVIAPIAFFTHLLPGLIWFSLIVLMDGALGGGGPATVLKAFLATLLAALFILPGHGMAARVYIAIAPNLSEPPKPSPGYEEA